MRPKKCKWLNCLTRQRKTDKVKRGKKSDGEKETEKKEQERERDRERRNMRLGWIEIDKEGIQ